MADREYICGYNHCLHNGEKVKASEAVVVGKKHYHWDCAALKQEMADLRTLYFERIDDKADIKMLAKTLNDLIFGCGFEVEYVRFFINYLADSKTRIKHPLQLLNLKTNNFIRKKWEKSKG